MILVDSNVLVAAISQTHAGHEVALGFLNADKLPPLLIAAHSHAETFVTLTKLSGPHPIALDPAIARNALHHLAQSTHVVGMLPIETIETVQAFADIGIGGRLYDYLIGRTGLLYGATAIVTFNTGPLRALFPQVAVHTPAEWLALNPAPPPP